MFLFLAFDHFGFAKFVLKCRDLSDNSLSGDIPFSVSKLKKLELL